MAFVRMMCRVPGRVASFASLFGNAMALPSTWASHETGGSEEATWTDYETGGGDPTTWNDLT